MIFVAAKMEGQQVCPPPLLVLLLDPGSEIWDTGMDKNKDPGYIPDPQH